jgi:hypothetical protein
VKFPVRKEDGSCGLAKGFVIKSKALRGYLPYSQRNVVNQAFRMLDTPYSWGGESGWQDCSGFIQEVFMTFGIYLPRDSKEQEKVGLKIKAFDIGLSPHEKISVIKKDAVPGVTAMFLKGHVMLYLGMDRGEPYAIHNIWAYRENSGINEKLMLIKRVAVTDLKLGEGSANGSLIDRENSLSVIRTGE